MITIDYIYNLKIFYNKFKGNLEDNILNIKYTPLNTGVHTNLLDRMSKHHYERPTIE